METIKSMSSTGNMSSPSSTTVVATSAHILVFPYPAQGHMIPLLDLTHLLLLRGLRVTILVTPNNLILVEPLLSAHPSSVVAALVLPFPSHPSLPDGAENLQDLPPNSFVPVMAALRRLHEPLLRWFATHPSPPSAIISDMFLGWTHHLALKRSIKRFVFSPSGAFYLSIAHFLWRNAPPLPRNDDGEVDQGADVLVDDIPGRPRFQWYQLSGLYRAYATGGPEAEFVRGELLVNLESHGLVLNTFNELEREHMDHIKRDLGHDRVWAVGPVSEVGHGPRFKSVFNEDQEELLMTWLDRCGVGEVVYVCFGSQGYLTSEQMEVLAFGLERSGVRFVWKIKEPSYGHVDNERFDKLPLGFEDRVAGRGLVIRKWVPQVLILRHRAVGAFLTHCGWNSVLEGLSAGVMMLTWPLGADQFSNAMLVVDQLKVGVRVGQGARSLPDPDELARALAESMNGSCKEHKSRGLEIKNMVKEVISEGGSSLVDLDGLIQHLSRTGKFVESSIGGI